MLFWHAEKTKIAKSFGPCQPAQTAQADMGRYISQMHEAPIAQRATNVFFSVENCQSHELDEILDKTKLKAFADDKFKEKQK